ncbi:MAG TPA: amidohydrolase family protein [Ktedonobacterales bacterium]|nr:amidohydrolase family protein [Ktedonobacterales bacterium]
MAKKHDKQDKHDKHDKHSNDSNGAESRVAGNGHLEAISSSSPAQKPSGWGKTVAITGVRLIDGTGADPLERATVILDGERIDAVGAANDVKIPKDAAVIDAEGMTLLPGLIDCHVHLFGQWGYDLLRGLMTPPSLSLLYAVPNARATVEAGITTVRDAGGAPAGVKMAIERGLFPGPRMLVSVSFLSQTGGHGDSMMPCCIDLGDNLLPDVPFGVVDGEDAMRAKVREILRAGADWIKLCTSGGVLSSADSPQHAQFTVSEIATAVYEAAAQGKRCLAHAQSNQGIKNAIEAGIASIEHGIYLDDEAIEMMVKRGVYLVPTLVAPYDVLDLAAARPGLLPDYAVNKSREVMRTHVESFRRAVEAGVKVAMGTDTGVGPHGGNARELELMVRNGMTPMQSIVASTRTAAELLRLDDQLGTITSGKLADLLLVESNPLEDIGALADAERLVLVLKGGVPMHARVAPASSRVAAVGA